jgi:hypothetical protein
LKTLPHASPDLRSLGVVRRGATLASQLPQPLGVLIDQQEIALLDCRTVVNSVARSVQQDVDTLARHFDATSRRVVGSRYIYSKPNHVCESLRVDSLGRRRLVVGPAYFYLPSKLSCETGESN